MPCKEVTDPKDLFHRSLYSSAVWQHRTHYKGYKICKMPFDLWSYQELFFMERPNIVIETGTAYGGSALYFVDLMRPWGGHVFTIDIHDSPLPKPQDKNITYFRWSSTDPELVEQIQAAVKMKADAKVMLVLDSNHEAKHVLAELDAYSDLADYIVVEDTNINGHPVAESFGPGPSEAVDEFLIRFKRQVWEEEKEWLKHGFSFNRWLKRVYR